MSVTFDPFRSSADTIISLLYASVRKVAKVPAIKAFGFHLKCFFFKGNMHFLNSFHIHTTTLTFLSCRSIRIYVTTIRETAGKKLISTEELVHGVW